MLGLFVCVNVRRNSSLQKSQVVFQSSFLPFLLSNLFNKLILYFNFHQSFHQLHCSIFHLFFFILSSIQKYLALLIGKTEERINSTGIQTKRRKEGTLDTENKNGCFKWLMNWKVWELRSHVSFTDGIEDINPPNRQTVSSHHDKIDTFLVWSEPFYCPPKLANKLYYFTRVAQSKDDLSSKYFLLRNPQQAPLPTQLLCWRQQRRLHLRKERDTILKTGTLDVKFARLFF